MIQPISPYNVATRRRAAVSSPSLNRRNKSSRAIENTAASQEIVQDALHGVASMMAIIGLQQDKPIAELLLQHQAQYIEQIANKPKKKGKPKREVSPLRNQPPVSNRVMKLQDYIQELAAEQQTVTIYNQIQQNSRENLFCQSRLYQQDRRQPYRETFHRRCESTNNAAGPILPIDLSNPFFFSLRNSCYDQQEESGSFSNEACSPQFTSNSRLSSDTTVYKSNDQQDTNPYMGDPHDLQNELPALARFIKDDRADHECSQYPLPRRRELCDLTNFL